MYTGVATFIDMMVGIGAGDDDTTFFNLHCHDLAGQGTQNAQTCTHTFLHKRFCIYIVDASDRQPFMFAGRPGRGPHQRLGRCHERLVRQRWQEQRQQSNSGHVGLAAGLVLSTHAFSGWCVRTAAIGVWSYRKSKSQLWEFSCAAHLFHSLFSSSSFR